MSTLNLTPAELAVCRATWTDPADYARRKTQRASASASARTPRGTLSEGERALAASLGRTEAEQLARRPPVAHDDEAASDDADDDAPEVAIQDRASARSRRAFGGPGFVASASRVR